MTKSFFVLAVAAFFISSCNKVDTIPPLADDTTNPTLTYPIVSFSSTEFFTPFGDTIHSLESSRVYGFELADTTLNVVSASKGIVTAVDVQPNGNYTVAAKYKSNSVFSFEYTGIKTPVVQAGDSLNPGTILGKISRTGEITFMVIKNGNEALCPQTFGSPGFNTAVQLAIDKHNTANPTDSVLGACYVQSLPK